MTDISGMIIALADGQLTVAVPLMDALREADLYEDAEALIHAVEGRLEDVEEAQRNGYFLSEGNRTRWRRVVLSRFWHLAPRRDARLLEAEEYGKRSGRPTDEEAAAARWASEETTFEPAPAIEATPANVTNSSADGVTAAEIAHHRAAGGNIQGLSGPTHENWWAGSETGGPD